MIERENAAILNESLKPLASRTIIAFQKALKDLNFMCPLYLTQNDGTLIRYSLVWSHSSDGYRKFNQGCVECT